MRIAFTFALLAVSLAASTPVLACNCTQGISVEQNYNDAEAVFYGVVESVHYTSKYDTKRRFWEFAIQGIWKGPDQPRIRIYAYGPDGLQNSCDQRFVIGQSYLVFARTSPGYPGRFRAHLCTGTVSGANVLKALRVIGRPEHEYEPL